MSFDIATIGYGPRLEAGSTLKLVKPGTQTPVLDAEGQEVTLTLRGRNSSVVQEARDQFNAERLERAAREGSKPLSAEELRENELRVLGAATVGWSWTELDGAAFPCTAENVRKFFTDPRFAWVREQARGFVENDGNFLMA
jgi:hypothetical protein